MQYYFTLFNNFSIIGKCASLKFQDAVVHGIQVGQNQFIQQNSHTRERRSCLRGVVKGYNFFMYLL